MTENIRRSSYSLNDSRLDGAVDDLVALCSRPSRDEALVKEMIVTALKMHLEETQTLDLKIASRAMKELRHAFRVFNEYDDAKKVTIFGSARVGEDTPEYRLARDFAHEMAHRGYMTITGAGGGIMQAGNEGAGREQSFGLNIMLPFEQHANRFIDGDPKLVNFRYFFPRKLMFVKEADALALFPGGFGTLDECMELLTLVQTGKSPPLPIVMMDVPGGNYWRGFVDFVRERMLDRAFINADDLHYFFLTESVEEACDHICHFYRNYHSMRVVRERMVLRLNAAPGEELLRRLDADFADILREGRFEARVALPEEIGEEDLAHLPRLVFRFDGRSFGRLRMLVDALNDAVARAPVVPRRPHHFSYDD